LHWDPWDRLAALRESVPNVCLQMLLRGRNTVGYTPYPDRVTDAFVREAAATGVDIFRIFDALNDVDQMRPAIDAVRATGTTVAEVALCYTGDLSDPAEQLYTLDYYLRLAERIVQAGAHVLAIKDMAGLLRPPAAAHLVRALRERFDLPVHLHTHDTAGGQLATLLAGWPEPFRSRALEGRRPAEPRAQLTDDDLRAQEQPRATLHRLLFPGPSREHATHCEQYGDTSVLPTMDFLYGLRYRVEHPVDLEPGVRLLVGIEAVSDADERGMRTVMCTLNGQLRPVLVRDRSVDARVKAAEKADRSDAGHVAAPFAGVVTLQADEGDAVEAGQTVATIEAMKMEAGITASRAGTVSRLAIGDLQ
jgi:pyruvate carboxylase